MVSPEFPPRGESHPESDLDVAVILRNADSATKMEIYDIVAEEMLRYEVDISPLVFAADRYEQMHLLGEWLHLQP